MFSRHNIVRVWMGFSRLTIKMIYNKLWCPIQRQHCRAVVQWKLSAFSRECLPLYWAPQVACNLYSVTLCIQYHLYIVYYSSGKIYIIIIVIIFGTVSKKNCLCVLCSKNALCLNCYNFQIAINFHFSAHHKTLS